MSPRKTSLVLCPKGQLSGSPQSNLQPSRKDISSNQGGSLPHHILPSQLPSPLVLHTPLPSGLSRYSPSGPLPQETEHLGKVSSLEPLPSTAHTWLGGVPSPGVRMDRSSHSSCRIEERSRLTSAARDVAPL